MRRLLRRLLRFLKTNPLKTFMLVVMPLLTGGALAALLGKLGLRLPFGLGRLARMGGKGGGVIAAVTALAAALGVGKASSGKREESRKSGGLLSKFGGVGGMVEGLGGLGGVVSMAKLFI